MAKLSAKTPHRLAQHYRHYLKQLTENVVALVKILDREMVQKESPERGRRLAALVNDLEHANDSARYFGLGVDYRKDKKQTARTTPPPKETKP